MEKTVIDEVLKIGRFKSVCSLEGMKDGDVFRYAKNQKYQSRKECG